MHIGANFEQHDGVYGSPKITRELKKSGDSLTTEAGRQKHAGARAKGYQSAHLQVAARHLQAFPWHSLSTLASGA